MPMNTTTRYGSLQIAAHWLVVLLLAAVYATMECRGFFPREARGILKLLHYSLGMTVLALGVLRLIRRFVNPPPAIEPQPGPWQALAAQFMHAALYAFLIAMPVAGWLVLSARGHAIPFFGLHLPALVAPDKGLAHTLAAFHETVGRIGYGLIGIHAAAALYHHYVLKDNTLERMLLKRRNGRSVLSSTSRSAFYLE